VLENAARLDSRSHPLALEFVLASFLFLWGRPAAALLQWRACVRSRRVPPRSPPRPTRRPLEGPSRPSVPPLTGRGCSPGVRRSPRSPHASSPLAGRGVKRAQSLQLLVRLVRNHCQSVHVAGDAGAGAGGRHRHGLRRVCHCHRRRCQLLGGGAGGGCAAKPPARHR